MCPLYSYECPACDHYFERLEKLDSPPFATCDNCLWEVSRIDCPGGDFRISGVGIANPKSTRT